MMILPERLQNLPPETLARFQEIVKVPITFENETEEEKCQTILNGLSEEELELAAQFSYAYWILGQLENEKSTSTTSLFAPLSKEVVRNKMATKVAKWHLHNHGNSSTKALKALQEACELRKTHKLHLLRTCFEKRVSSSVSDDDNEQLAAEEEMRKGIQSDLEKQLVAMRGQDCEGRPILIKLPRMQGDTTEQAYMHTQLYIAERSAAVTEYLSQDKYFQNTKNKDRKDEDTLVAIFSMQDQNRQLSPPISWQLSTIRILQQLYPGRVHKLIILEAPFLIRQIYTVLKPFLSSAIKDCIQFLSGFEATQKFFQEMIHDPNKSGTHDDTTTTSTAEGILLTRNGELVKPINVHEYLYDVPFYSPYDYN